MSGTCRPADDALVVGRTTAAEFSICRTGAGATYYRGLTPSNGESVQVDDAVTTPDGWLVTAPDGTTYAISPSSMVITLTDGSRVTARMLTYRGATIAGRPAGTSSAPVRRDADGFALGGPPMPSQPSVGRPSHADCLRYLTELRAWSDYQNQHRPAGSTNELPFSGDVQYLWTACHLNYY